MIGMPDKSLLILVPTAFESRFLFGERVHRTLVDRGATRCRVSGREVAVALCGFGLAAAGAGAAFALGNHLRANDAARPQTAPVILVGIAGTYDPARAPVGSALLATDVRCVGIGRGTGAAHRSAAALGWPQGLPLAGLPPVGDDLLLAAPHLPGKPVLRGGLLSVTTAAATLVEAHERAARFPGAAAEEMEVFAVGLAARLYGARLIVVRGLSNVAGETDHAAWRTAEALAAAKALLLRVVERIAAADGLGGQAGR